MIRKILILIVILIPTPSIILADDIDVSNYTFKCQRVYKYCGNNAGSPYQDTSLPQQLFDSYHGWVVTLGVYSAATGEPLSTMMVWVSYEYFGCTTDVISFQNMPYSQLASIMLAIESNDNIYANLSDSHKFVFGCLQGCCQELGNLNQTIGYAYSVKYNNAYLWGCNYIMSVMDLCKSYNEIQQVQLESGSISVENLSVNIDKDILKQAITEALEGMGNYYVPPEITPTERPAPSLYPTWEYTIQSESATSPYLQSIGNGVMDGSIDIPVFGQTYSFDWSSQLSGLASNLDPYRQAFRYMLLTIVAMSLLFLVWKTLRQY